MSRPPAPPAAPTPRIWLGALILAAATLLVYANALFTPFVFDDRPAILENPSIRRLDTALFPPPTAGSAAGRPVINLSLALNHALGGDHPAGYRVVNILIHAAAALALFGFVRRTLLLPRLRPRWGEAARPVAFWSALLWTVHPLLTESVTCIAQRTESLLGLWFLVMFYCLARAAEPGAPARWRAGAFAACLLGVFTKEVMVAGPVLALFYHVLLVDGSWRVALARHGKFHALLALTWVPLALLVAQHGPRDGTGFGEGVTVWQYALTQCRAIVLYLRLSCWPHPLVLDYGTGFNRSLGEVWPQALLLAALLAITTFATLRKRPVAFAGLWFFSILAPSSSVLPLVTQTIAEHRMYLPLAAVLVPLAAATHAIAGRRGLGILGVVAVALAAGTVRRNHDYRTSLSIWQDTVAKAPDNARARTNLGNVLDDAGRWAEALREYDTALQLQPDYALAHYNRANLLVRHGRIDEVIAGYREAIRLDPRATHAHLNLGNTYAQQGRWAEAQAEFATVVRLDPTDALAHNNLGNALFNLGHPAEAAAAFERALPGLDNPTLRFNLATALATAGRPQAALEHFQAAAKQDPTRADIPYSVGVLLLNEGRRPEAIARLREALRLDPNYAEARQLLNYLDRSGP